MLEEDELEGNSIREQLDAYDSRFVGLRRTIDEIQNRNLQVSANKAWETSFTRRFLIASLTFIFTSIVFLSIGVDDPLRNALIPTTGYIVSTFSVPWVKLRWMAKYYTAIKRDGPT